MYGPKDNTSILVCHLVLNLVGLILHTTRGTFEHNLKFSIRYYLNLEREEDLTGPYAFLANKWLAFDDDTSLKIKVQ